MQVSNTEHIDNFFNLISHFKTLITDQKLKMKTAAVIFIMLVFVAVGYSRNILNPEGPYIEQLESEGSW